MSGVAIELDHGAGGGLSRELVMGVIAPRLGPAHTGRGEDSAVLDLGGARIAVTTDSFVVDPPFFGNGDIGTLAVCGTVNDLAVAGATPRYLTLALVLEEGLPLADLERVLDSVRVAALAAGVEVVAGDTKVVRAGEVDRLFLTTAGVGVFERDVRLGPDHATPGDAVLVTGWLGNHAIHLLSLREGLGFEERVLSDCAPLAGLLGDVLEAHAADVRWMRDLTRGGLGAALNELADATGLAIRLEAAWLPIQRETAMAADMLGLDPVHLANEGCVCVVVAPHAAAAVLGTVRRHPHGRAARLVGAVGERVGGADGRVAGHGLGDGCVAGHGLGGGRVAGHGLGDGCVAGHGLGDGRGAVSALPPQRDGPVADGPVTIVREDGTVTVVEWLYGAELPRLC